MARIASIAAVAVIVAACSSDPGAAPGQAPQLEVTCPDPDDRAKLAEGATWRDLAVSRSEALRGWGLCHGAAQAAQGGSDDRM